MSDFESVDKILRKKYEDSSEHAEKSQTSTWSNLQQIKTPIDIKIINIPDDLDQGSGSPCVSSNFLKGSSSNSHHQQQYGLNAPQSMIDCSYSGPIKRSLNYFYKTLVLCLSLILYFNHSRSREHINIL